MDLITAVRGGDLQAVARLAAGAGRGELKAALKVAVELGRVEVAEALRRAGGTPEAEWLYAAIRADDPKATAAALAAGVDPGRAGEGYHYTPAAYAVDMGKPRSLEAMLDRGVSPNLTLARGEPLLHLAVARERIGGLKVLFADEAARERGEVLGDGRGSSVVDLLIRRGADLHALHRGRSALCVAFIELGEDSDRVAVLRRLGASEAGVLGFRLMRAMFDGDGSEAPALPDAAPASELRWALSMAASRADVARMGMLVARGADVNAPYSAVLCSAINSRTGPAQRLEAVLWLLSRGADPNRRDHADQAPLELAQAEALPGVVEALKGAGAVMPRRVDLAKVRGCAEPGGNAASLSVLAPADEAAEAVADGFGGRVIRDVYGTARRAVPPAALVVQFVGQTWTHVLPMFESWTFAERLGTRAGLDVLYYAYGKAAAAYLYTLWRGGKVAEAYDYAEGRVKFESKLGTKVPSRRANPIGVIDKAFKRLDAWAIDTGLATWPTATREAVMELIGVDGREVAGAHVVEGMSVPGVT